MVRWSAVPDAPELVYVGMTGHVTGEAFIGREKFSVIMESGFGLKKVYFITLYQNENFFTSKIF